MTTRDVRDIDVSAIRQLLASDLEVALIDIREAGEFGTGHALLAVNLPWSQLEVRARATLPRIDHPVIVQDQHGGERARRAVQRLQLLGYRDVRLARGNRSGDPVSGEIPSGLLPMEQNGIFMKIIYYQNITFVMVAGAVLRIITSVIPTLLFFRILFPVAYGKPSTSSMA